MRSPELHIAHKPFISSRPVSGFLIPHSSFLIICALLLGGQMLQAQTTWDGSTDSNLGRVSVTVLPATPTPGPTATATPIITPGPMTPRMWLPVLVR